MISHQQLPRVLPNFKASQNAIQLQIEDTRYGKGTQLQHPLADQKMLVVLVSIFSGISIGLLTPALANGLPFISERAMHLAEIFTFVMLYGS